MIVHRRVVAVVNAAYDEVGPTIGYYLVESNLYAVDRRTRTRPQFYTLDSISALQIERRTGRKGAREARAGRLRSANHYVGEVAQELHKIAQAPRMIAVIV